MRARLVVLAMAACLPLAACSTVERGTAAPSDAGSPVTIDSTSRISRLLLLAPVATCSGCDGSFMTEPADVTVRPVEIMDYVADWKDYEVSLVPKDDETDTLVKDLAAWHEHLQQNEPLPQALQARLEALGQARIGHAGQGRPGVLVVHSHVRYLTPADWALYFMIVGMPNQFKKLSERNTSVALYDPWRGRLLWEAFFNCSPMPSMPLHRCIMGQLEKMPAAARGSPPPH